MEIQQLFNLVIIDGEAEVFEIYPNKSMNLIGNAKLS